MHAVKDHSAGERRVATLSLTLGRLKTALKFKLTFDMYSPGTS
jgi:hypothetical protein